MILGIGIDLVEVSRIEQAVAETGARFLERIFTPAEIADCDGRADRHQALAARFAAKEACLKALGSGISEGLSLRQVEVVREANGRPMLELHGNVERRAAEIGVRTAHVSLTHQKGVAGAFVVLED